MADSTNTTPGAARPDRADDAADGLTDGAGRAAGRFPGAVLQVERMRLGRGVRIAPGAVLVADELVLGHGASIGADCDVRSARVDISAGARVGDGCRILAADVLHLGAASLIDTGADITCRSLAVGEQTYIGSRLRIGCGASMEERSTVAIGAQCQIAPEVIINPTEPVVIGDRVGMSMRVALWTHGYHSGHEAADGHAGRFAGIVIEDEVWLAYDVAVMPGAQVGAGTQVAARAVVTGPLPPGVLAAGVPAVVKRPATAEPLDGTGRARHLEGLVEAWLARLAFKGCQVVAHPRRAWRVAVRGAEWDMVLDTGSAGAETLCLRQHGDARTTLFCFGPRLVRGQLDELGHDLRDYCRRRSWLFPYRTNSVGLVPELFARLLQAHPGAAERPR